MLDKEKSILIKPLRLLPRVQHYHWGLHKKGSLVGLLSSEKDDTGPYAELWVGAHPDLPSDVEAAVPCNLNQLILSYPNEMLGEKVISKFGKTLPFLFKVLSIGKPLSIQAHPDKLLAAKLYREKGYPDDHHKPEMAIALSEVEMLCGFRHLSDMAVDFSRIKELRESIGDDLLELLIKRTNCENDKILKELCNKLLNLPPNVVSSRCASLRDFLLTQGKLCHRDSWVLRLLKEDFQNGDVGIFFFYLMNLLRLSPNNAVFIPPNTAHAYLSGELAECMANSDNVVRGGLTPKLKDIETLLAMLNYSACCPDVLKPMSLSNLINYTPPEEFDEFSLKFISDEKILEVEGNEPIILFSIDGSGAIRCSGEDFQYGQGNSFFIPASISKCEIRNNSGRTFIVSSFLRNLS